MDDDDQTESKNNEDLLIFKKIKACLHLNQDSLIFQQASIK